LTRAIRGLLNSLGVFHYKHWGGPMGEPGVSDIIGCYMGRMLAIEIKAPNGKVSEHQREFLDRVNAAGGLAFVARSVDDVIITLGVQDRFLQFTVRQKP
jgi:penicillin-binding protein-related factor A (putative recombinase)